MNIYINTHTIIVQCVGTNLILTREQEKELGVHLHVAAHTVDMWDILGF